MMPLYLNTSYLSGVVKTPSNKQGQCPYKLLLYLAGNIQDVVVLIGIYRSRPIYTSKGVL